MNRKLKAYQIACYLNLCCLLVVSGVFIYQAITAAYSTEGIFDFIWLFIILFVYAVNFNYGIKQVNFIQKESSVLTISQKSRKIYFAFEIALAPFYTFFVYLSIINMNMERFGYLSENDIIDIFTTICFYGAYLASMARILLTSHIVAQVTEKNKKMLEQIGK